MSLFVWRLILMVLKLEVFEAIEPHVDVGAEVRTFLATLVGDRNVDRANMCKKLVGQHGLVIMVAVIMGKKILLTSKNTHSSSRVGIGTNMNQDYQMVSASTSCRRELSHVMAWLGLPLMHLPIQLA